MSQHLPYGEFKWLNLKEIDKFDVNSVGENSFNEYISEVVKATIIIDVLARKSSCNLIMAKQNAT